MCIVQDLSKHQRLIPEMLFTVDDQSRTNNKVTSNKLKAKLHEQCSNFLLCGIFSNNKKFSLYTCKIYLVALIPIL